MGTIHASLLEAGKRLRSVSENSTLDAELLLASVLNTTRTHFRIHPEHTLDPAQEEHFERLCERRLRGEPIAYILGAQEFWSLTFRVTPATLIPRPETECLVESCLQHMPVGAGLMVLEIGLGSGAIAAALARERPSYRFTGVELSPAAAEVARRNLKSLGVDNRVEVLIGDLYEPVPHRRFDVIVSNPPYVSDADHEGLMRDVRDFEPRIALTAGTDGLDVIRRLVHGAASHLTAQGLLAFEHGFNQQDLACGLMAAAGFSTVVRGSDLAGLPRFLLGRTTRSV